MHTKIPKAKTNYDTSKQQKKKNSWILQRGKCHCNAALPLFFFKEATAKKKQRIQKLKKQKAHIYKQSSSRQHKARKKLRKRKKN